MNEKFYLEAKVQKIDKKIEEAIQKAGIQYPHHSLAFFKAAYAKVDGKSANANNVILMESVKDDVKYLIGTQVNINHYRKGFIVGSIIDAYVTSEDEIQVIFTFDKLIYSNEYEEALKLMDNDELSVSFELMVEKANIEVDGAIKKLKKVHFCGCGLLFKLAPAYKDGYVLTTAMKIIEDALNQEDKSLVFASAKNIADKWTKIGEMLEKAINEKQDTINNGGIIMDKKANDALLAAQRNIVISEFGEDAVKDWKDEDFCDETKINTLRESLKSNKEIKIEDKKVEVKSEEVRPEQPIVVEEKAEEFVEEDKEIEEGAKWTRKFINSLPDSSFAVIEPAYKEGKTDNKNCRHLPFKDANGKVDLPHLRNALARVNQIQPVTDSISTEELRTKAINVLEKYRKLLETASDKLETEQAEIEKEEIVAQPTKLVTEVTQIVTDIMNPETKQETVVVETETVRTVNDKVQEERKEVVEVTYTYAQVEAIKAEKDAIIVAKDAEIKQKDETIVNKDSLILSKDEEIKFIKENAKKIVEARIELGEYVKDLSDEDLIKNTDKLEIARLKKENAKLKEQKSSETVVANDKTEKEVLTAKTENKIVLDEDSDKLVAQYVKETYNKKNRKS